MNNIIADPFSMDLMRAMQRCVALAFVVLCGACWGQATPHDGGIYTCIDDQGKELRRDRYIAECRHKEQRILNRDGSVREVVRPTLTPDEQARREADERAAREAQAARNDNVKYDRLLLKRFPDEAAHNRAREAALAPGRRAIESGQARVRELVAERRGLLEEAEFYRGRPMPPALKQRLDDNDATAAAQRDAIRNTQAEQARINSKFDVELERLRKLWKGAEPGSLGPPPM